MSIADELLIVKGSSELLLAEDALTWAEQNRKSELAQELEWNDKKAGHEHRLWQIRRLIAIHITYSGGERKFISLSVDRARDGGGYRDLDDVLKDRSLYAIALTDALRELERFQEKYAHLKQLKPVWSAIRKVRTTAKGKGGGARQTRTTAQQA